MDDSNSKHVYEFESGKSLKRISEKYTYHWSYENEANCVK